MSAKKTTAKKSVVAKKPNPLHERLIKIFTRPNGATVADVAEVNFYGSARAALQIVERKGYETSVVEKEGELNRYVARRAS